MVLIAVVGATLGSSVAGAEASTSGAVPAPTAYVTNSSLDTVTVVHGGRVVATIPVGNGPVGIAVTPDNATAYVANYGFFGDVSHTVTPIDTATNTAGTPIKVGSGPMAIAITPDGSKAVVTLQGTPDKPGHQAVVIDLATRAILARVKVGVNPESVAVSPDGATAYVGDFSSAAVTPIDLTLVPPRAERSIRLPGTAPRAIAVAPDGQTAYVLDAENATVIPIQLATRTVGPAFDLKCTQGGDPGCTPTAILIDPSGSTAYVAAAGSGDVMQLSLPSLSVLHVIPAGGYPDALGYGSGRLFVSNGASNSVSVYSANHHPVEVPGLDYPFGVAVVPGSAG